MWKDVEKGFKIAFRAAWEAYQSQTVPIGACILDQHGELVTIGQNQIMCDGPGQISMHQLAHAEINAILNISETEDAQKYKDIRKYTLYSVMEPCPLCFGAIVMGSIRNVKFAARDPHAGATSLGDKLGYIENKGIKFEGPFNEMETVQLAMHTCYELTYGCGEGKLIEAFETIDPISVKIGRELFTSGAVSDFVEQGALLGNVYDYVADIVATKNE